MADQIALRIAESIVSAGSAVSVAANFRTRSTGVASTPSSIRYRVDCLTSQKQLINWTSISAANEATIEVPGTSNGTINRDRDFEERQITVEIDTGLSTQSRMARTWKNRNIHTFDTTFTFDDALQLEPFYAEASIESGLTIEHYQYPVGHRFRYLDTFDVVDAHYYRRTDAEISAGVTPTSFQYQPGDARRYGAVGDDSTDNSTALTTWLTLCEAAGIEAYLPYGIYRYSTAIDLDNSNPGGFVLRGDSSGDYGTSAGNAPTRGSILKYTGAGVGLTIDSGTTTSPKHVRIEGITFHDGGTATDGLRLISATWCEIDRCVFAYFDQTGGRGLRLSINLGGFTGGIWLTRNQFVGCDTAVYSDSTTINIFHVISNGFHSNENGVVMGPPATGAFFRDIQFARNDFEETAGTDILFNGGCGSVLIAYNYFEQNDAVENDPRINFAGTGPTNAFVQAIDIHTNVFSKQLQNAGEALIRIRNFDGLTVYNNWSAYPASGSENDRYFVELVNGTNAANFYVEPSRNVSGATPYPILHAGAAYSSSIDSRSINFVGAVPQSVGANLLTATISNRNMASTDTLALTDVGIDKHVTNGVSGNTTLLDTQANIVWLSQSVINIMNGHSSGNLTIVRGSGVALYLNNVDGDRTLGPRSSVTIRRTASNSWSVTAQSGTVS